MMEKKWLRHMTMSCKGNVVDVSCMLRYLCAQTYLLTPLNDNALVALNVQSDAVV